MTLFDALGFRWNRSAVPTSITAHSIERVCFRFHKMRDDLIETLHDCANALGELLPRNHAYRKIVDKANRLLDRHDQSSTEQRAADALRDLMDALPAGTQTSMTVFKPEVDGQKAGAVKAFLMAENADDLRCAQWVITHGSAKRGEEQWPL